MAKSRQLQFKIRNKLTFLHSGGPKRSTAKHSYLIIEWHRDTLNMPQKDLISR